MADNLILKEEFLLNPITEHNITDAAIATFETNFRHPVKVEIPFKPVQDLHGMDYPYPAGTSVNLIPDTTDTENGYVAGYYLKDNGTTATGANNYISEYFEIDPATTYTWSNRSNTSVVSSICFYDENKDYISGIAINSQYSQTFTPPEGTVYCRSTQTTYAFQETHPAGAAFQLEVGSTATPYQRYSNICQIEGWTGCEIRKSSENILDPYSVVLKQFLGSSSYVPETNTLTISANLKECGLLFPVKPNTQYSFGLHRVSGGSTQFAIYEYSDMPEDKENYVVVTREVKSVIGSPIVRITTNSSTKYACFYCKKTAAGSSASVINEFWISPGNTQETYKPYQGETFPITFTNPDTGDPMTVYGGTVALNEDGSVDLVKDRAIITMNGTGPSSQGVSFNNKGSRKSADEYYTRIYGKTSSQGNLFIGNVCSHGPEPPNGDADSLGIIYFRMYAPPKQTYHEPRLVFPHSMGINTTAKANAWLAAQAKNGTPVRYTYYIADPVHYHFPSIGQLKSFLGVNNIWSDIGNVNAKYLTQNSETGMEYRGDRALELRRRAMLANAPTIHTTVGSEVTSGLASFKSYIKAPIKKIEIPFAPKQDLHGMDYPYPAGGSVNLIPDTTDASNGYVAGYYLRNDNTTTVNKNYYISEYFEVDPAVTYTWSNRTTAAVAPSICFYDSDKTFISGINFDNKLSHTFTPPEGAAYARSTQTTYAYQASNPSRQAIQLEIGSTATPYQRYSNICSIEGYDTINIVNSDHAVRTYTISATQEGSGRPSPTNIRPIKPGLVFKRDNGSVMTIYGGTLTVNRDGTSTLLRDRVAYTYDGVNYKVNREYVKSNWIRGGIVYMPGNVEYDTARPVYCDRLLYYAGTGVAAGEYSMPTPEAGKLYCIIQLTNDASEKGVTSSNAIAYVNNWLKENPVTISYKTTNPTTYSLSVTETIRALEAFGVKEQVIPIAFTDPLTGDPLTVYGGTVALNEDGSVVLNKNYELQRFTGWDDTYHRIYSSTADLDYADPTSSGVSVNLYGDYVRLTFALNRKGPYAQYDRDSRRYKAYACNIAPHMSSYNNQSVHWYRDGYLNIVLPISLAGNTKESVINYLHQLALDGNPLTLLIPLLTPMEYTFSDIGQLKTFLGENNFWCDISDDITVKYLNRGFGN